MSKLDGDLAVERLNGAVGAFLDIVTEPEGTMVPVPGREPQPSLAERVKQNLKPSTEAAQGFAEEAKKAAEEAWRAAGLAGSAVQVDVFTASGTWKKPAGAKAVHLLIIGGGAGGASGQVCAPGSSGNGGAGGGGGGAVEMLRLASDFGTSASVSVGKGGAGGPPSGNQSSNNGGNGGGSNVRINEHITISVEGGRTNASGNGHLQGGAGGVGGVGTYGGRSNSGSGGASGGSGGGGVYLAFHAGGPVAYPQTVNPNGSHSAPSGRTDGAPGIDMAGDPRFSGYIPGMGGGGGASSLLSNGGAGGKAVFGGGGGGGGAARTPYQSGAGGIGGDGLVIITTFM